MRFNIFSLKLVENCLLAVSSSKLPIGFQFLISLHFDICLKICYGQFGQVDKSVNFSGKAISLVDDN